MLDYERFDPDQYRMSIGEHLDELRRRVIRSLAGVFLMAGVSLFFGRTLLAILCRPLVDVLGRFGLNTQLAAFGLTDAFMTYVKVSLIAAAALAGPWVLYQVWAFVAKGLYPRERKAITRYMPLSITLLLSGMAFVYFAVLPMTLWFFVAFTAGLSVPTFPSLTPAVPMVAPSETTTQATFVQAVDGDPPSPRNMQIWFDTREGRLKIMAGDKIRVIPFGAAGLLSTHFDLPDYLSLVFQLMLTFGLAFQMPLVVMAAARIGIVTVAQLKSWRRYMYFLMVVLAAAVSPGDVVTATIALLVPLIFLYELGIWLAIASGRRAKKQARLGGPD